MTSVSIVQHGIQVDETSLTKAGNVISVKADGIGFAKLNADIVGIDTASGKVNSINTTNFSSLDGVNLTNTGDLVLIEEVTASGSSTNIDSGTLDLSVYENILVVWHGEVGGVTQGVTLRLNDDAGATNYEGVRVLMGSDNHATSDADAANIGHAQTGKVSNGMVFIGNSASEKPLISMGGDSDNGRCTSTIWIKAPEAITKISLLAATNNWTNESKMSIYGLK